MSEEKISVGKLFGVLNYSDENDVKRFIDKMTPQQALFCVVQSAKLNQEKSEILAVYIDRKTAANQNNYESISALDNPVKKFALTKGHYYTLYDNCSEELRTSFEASNNGYPILYRNGIGQYDENENLIHIFLCKYY